MPTANDRRIATLRTQIREERKWIEDHGRNRAGYIQRYGSVRDPEHSGDGGEAIFEADRNKLLALETELSARTGGPLR